MSRNSESSSTKKTVAGTYPWCVYILENCDASKLYTGITNDLPARVEKHNAGKGAKATRAKRPWKLVWRFLCKTKHEAAFFEVRIKKLPRAKKLVMVQESLSIMANISS